MSIHKAKKMFEDGVKYVDAQKDPATYDLIAGLYQLTKGLESEIRQLHSEIAHVSQQVDYLRRP